MSTFKTKIVAVNPKDESQRSEPVEAAVDTGSELTWLPSGLLEAADIFPRVERGFVLADGSTLTRDVGYAILESGDGEFATIEEVVFGEPGDLSLLGVRTLEGFGAMVDNIEHRLVARALLAAGNRGV
ncbi:MAG: hypothetical protein AAF236_12385 [Verrucomicrobiota bacterium]